MIVEHPDIIAEYGRKGFECGKNIMNVVKWINFLWKQLLK